MNGSEASVTLYPDPILAYDHSNNKALGGRALFFPKFPYLSIFTWRATANSALSIKGWKTIFKRENFDPAYAAVRPTGHKADECKARGFFVFNNLDVADLQRELGLKKVCIFY